MISSRGHYIERPVIKWHSFSRIDFTTHVTKSAGGYYIALLNVFLVEIVKVRRIECILGSDTVLGIVGKEFF